MNKKMFVYLLGLFLSLIGCGLMVDLSKQTMVWKITCVAAGFGFGFCGFILFCLLTNQQINGSKK